MSSSRFEMILFLISMAAALIANAKPLPRAGIHHSSRLNYVKNPIATALQEIEKQSGRESLLPKLRFVRTITTRPFIMATCVDCLCMVVCHDLAQHELWAPVETAIFERIFNQTREDARMVVDVGANIGYFTMLSAAWGARVYSFEPNVHAAALLRVNIALQSASAQQNIFFYPNGIGATEGESRVTFPENHGWALGKLEHDDNKGGPEIAEGGNKTTRSEGNGGIGVQMSRLSSIVNHPVTILKVDTEGFESFVFDGAYDVLKHVEYVIVEIKDFNSPTKRDLMHRIVREGGFTHVYIYLEQYHSNNYPLEANLHDVTDVVVNRLYDVSISSEDFVFSRGVFNVK